MVFQLRKAVLNGAMRAGIEVPGREIKGLEKVWVQICV
jgi:hypothetical protein